MFLRTLGHATLSLADGAESPPLLATDPWLIGSCYWRSWWLERYPSEAQIESLRGARFVYLTHEHPDHFHPPSLRRIGKAPELLVPELTRDRMGEYLRAHGFRARTVPAVRALELRAGVRIRSLPTLGNDSALLIDSPHAFIANLNDARPTPDQLLVMRKLRRAAKQKPCILLASYSAAGIGNSLYRRGKRIDFAGHGRHLAYVKTLARALDAQLYVPFASQVSFERPDTRWANAHRVRFDDVQRALASSALRVLPPYVTLDLASGAHHSEHETPALREADIEARVRAQLASEVHCLSQPDQQQLAEKLRAAGRGWLPLFFPRGIGFDFGAQQLWYDPLRGRVIEGAHPASMTLALPAQAVRDVLHTGFMSDLCIPMFTRVELGAGVLPHFVYGFFLMLQLHDVGATASAAGFARWLGLMAQERGRAVLASFSPFSRSAP